MNRVMKIGEKPIAEKVSNINHADNKDLTRVVEVKQGHKLTVKWSQAYADFKVKDRLFDIIIANSKDNEEREQKRLFDVEALLHQRKRGTRDVTSTD